ncbi:MAG TPA: arsenic resistance N-acetyltransferase ArsN2 [Noviherbaspirillum sp.]|uniref:arsenic resistance N-acetyltransferase ArsN2 n=1 Tax=Noviherbaspirillum sp. TaxID=1926288 RepID=UPI002B4623F3|nr:arsenic resistance N-acetyltransferase ArsN2 [Noviherbaspirillum sp.]HJV84244.1 arsenic resistance N-acetyltransferase ArsN2 [Noviherbaspirillum sp.]
MFSIRTSRPDDLPALKTLLATCGLPSEDLTAQHLEHFIVFAQSSRIVASVGIEKLGTDALLRSLAVDPMMRGEGFGNRLLQEIEAHALRHGVRRLYLLTTSADSFFEHHGYQRVERSAVPESIRNTTQYASLCPASAICMCKSLS